MLDDLVIEVERETENEERLHRFWIGLLNGNHSDVVKRKSVILCSGKNTIRLTWTMMKTTTVAFAALYQEKDDLVPVGVGATARLRIGPPNSVTIVWEINLNYCWQV